MVPSASCACAQPSAGGAAVDALHGPSYVLRALTGLHSVPCHPYPRLMPSELLAAFVPENLFFLTAFHDTFPVLDWLPLGMASIGHTRRRHRSQGHAAL